MTENLSQCFADAARWRALIAYAPAVFAAACFAATLLAFAMFARGSGA